LSNTTSEHDKVIESPFVEANSHSQVVTDVIDKVTASKFIDANYDTTIFPSPPRKSSPMKEQSLVAAKAPNNSMLALKNPFSLLLV